MSVNPIPLDHAAHDEVLVAALASGEGEDLATEDATAARRLVDACAACARLHEDLRLLAGATASLPAPQRPRDFRLSEAEAARLATHGWRRLLVPLTGPRFAFVQPLGGALAALGLAGLLVSTVPSVLRSPLPIVSSGGSAVSAPEAADRAAGSTSPTGGGPAQAPVLAAPQASTGPVGAAGAAQGSGVPPSVAVEPSAAAGGAPAPVPAASAGSGAEALPAVGPSGSGSDAKGSAGLPAANPSGPMYEASRGTSPAESSVDPALLLAATSAGLIVIGVGLFAVGRSARRRASA